MLEQTAIPDKNSIQTILVVPRNSLYARYVINNGSPHVMKYRDLEKFLIELLPRLSWIIRKYLYTFTNFILFVQEEQVEKLEFDFEKQKRNILEDMFKEKNKVIHENEIRANEHTIDLPRKEKNSDEKSPLEKLADRLSGLFSASNEEINKKTLN